MLSFATPVIADDGDDTLRFYLSKSDLVVRGVIVSTPIGEIDEVGVVNYICEFKIAEVLKGKKPSKSPMAVNVIRFEMGKDDRVPFLKKGGKCILFLKQARRGTIPAWHTVDMWFGIQRPSPWMVRSLKRLAGEKKRP
ncbi:MAG: hypothetical protein IH991_05540 [Planctomycetes bacterium]|nr:hypothetical protein [Planctomycetota bacterium]